MSPPPVYPNGSLLADRFEIVRRIGEGGMGIVYEALDCERGTTVALKSITQPDPTAIFRFKREFRALADIVHPNLVPLYELVSTGDQWFFTMQLVEGTDLARYLRPPSKVASGVALDVVMTNADLEAKTESDPAVNAVTANQRVGGAAAIEARPVSISEMYDWAQVDWRRVRRTFAQLASAVRALHDANRLHRDLKPSNVLVRPDGTVVVLDFGLVAELERTDEFAPIDVASIDRSVRFDTARAALSDEIVTGTIPYMAPEQVTGEPLTAACDWYAVGVMLYQVATGRLPHEGAPSKILANKVNTVPMAPRLLNPSIPPDLDALCVALLQLQPTLRPPASAIIDGLRKAKSYEMAAVDPEDRARRSFVGRAAFIDELDACWRSTVAGRSSLCLVRGATGEGKSALVDHFIRSKVDASRATVLRARCFEHESVPCKTVDGVIDALVKHVLTLRADELDAMIPDSIGSLSALFPVLARSTAVARAARANPAPIAANERRAQAESAFRALLASLSATRPCLIVVDDAQWGDVDGMRMLAALWDEPAVRAMVVVVLRTDLESESAALVELTRQREQHPSLAVSTIDVKAMTPNDARALARSLVARTGSSVSDDLWIERIVDWSTGSPWLLELLVESHATLGVIARSQSLDALIRARAETLSEKERALLDVICVAGQPLRVRVAFDAAFGQQSAPDAISVLCKAFLARTSGPLLDDVVEPFHERVRDGLLRTMSAEAKALAHERIALALEAAGRHEHEAMALHWSRAGADSRAAEQWLLAAKALFRAGDREQARHALQRAIDNGSDSTAGEARALLAESLVEQGEIDAALALAREAVDLPKDWGHATVAAIASQARIKRADESGGRGLRPDELRLLTTVARGALHSEPLVTAGLAATALVRSGAQRPDGAMAAVYALMGASLARLDFMGVVHPDEWGRAAIEALDSSSSATNRAEVLFVVAQHCLALTASAEECEALLDRALSSATMLDQRAWITACADALVESHFFRGADAPTMNGLVARLTSLLSQRGLAHDSRWAAPMWTLVHSEVGGDPWSEALSALTRTARATLLVQSGREHDARATIHEDDGHASEGAMSATMRGWLHAVLDARASRGGGVTTAGAMASALATAARMHVLSARCPARFEAMTLLLDAELAETLGRAPEALDRRARARRSALSQHNGLIASMCDPSERHWTAHRTLVGS